ncbi:MAG: hypothetical protein R8P61_22610 [Bacteroidia bacterium]|nr:hypothetical protein [Bacteroidia bacterium]
MKDDDANKNIEKDQEIENKSINNTEVLNSVEDSDLKNQNSLDDSKINGNSEQVSKRKWGFGDLEKNEKRSTILANLLVIVGIVFGISQYNQIERHEKKTVALEIVKQANTAEILQRLKRLKILSSPIIDIDTAELNILFFSDLKNDSIRQVRKASIDQEIKKEFLRAYESVNNWSKVSDDFNVIFNAYEQAAGLYNHDLANKKIIAESLYGYILLFSKIKIRWPIITEDLNEGFQSKQIDNFLKDYNLE